MKDKNGHELETVTCPNCGKNYLRMGEEAPPATSEERLCRACKEKKIKKKYYLVDIGILKNGRKSVKKNQILQGYNPEQALADEGYIDVYGYDTESNHEFYYIKKRHGKYENKFDAVVAKKRRRNQRNKNK